MERLPIILLAVVCAGLIAYMYSLRTKLDIFFDLIEASNKDMAEANEHDNEFRAEARKELSKARSAADECADMVRKLRKRVKTLEEQNEECQRSMAHLAATLVQLQKKQDEFDQLADESVRAQIDAEKAWAEGVRAIAGYGATVPTLNTKELGNE